MKLSEFIKSCKENENINLTHFIVIKDNSVLCDYCKFPYNMESLRLFFSMTKSITSLAVGIAVDKGLISLDDYVYEFFEDKLTNNVHPNVFKIKIKHLLTMSVGIDYNTYSELVVKPDWVKAFFEQEFPNEPGTKYLYSTHATHMLSAIITSVTGLSLKVFLDKNLFFNMGIDDVQWELSPEGLTAGGMGLSLTPKSVVKIAKLLLNNGVFGGKRLISEKYLSEATTLQINKIQDDYSYFKGNGYGYQFHIARDGYYYLDGAFGQLMLICPEKKTAFIAFSNNSKTESLLAEIYKHFIYSDFENEIQVLPICNKKIIDAISFPNDCFSFGNNPLNISSVSFNADKIFFSNINGREDIIKFDFNEIVYGRAWFVKDLQEHEQEYASKVVFATENRIALKVYWIETPYVATYEFEFNDSSLIFRFNINLSFTLNSFEIRGRK